MSDMATPERRDLTDAWERLGTADDPLGALDAARRLREAAELLEHDLVREARTQGVSWSRIGGLYGLTKQGAQQRFHAKRPKGAKAPKEPRAAKDEREPGAD